MINMMLKPSSIKGAIIGGVSNGIANYITLGSLQPVNIVAGLIVGAVIGWFI